MGIQIYFWGLQFYLFVSLYGVLKTQLIFKNLKLLNLLVENLYTSMYILHLLVVYFFGVNNIDIGVFKPVLVFIITALIS